MAAGGIKQSMGFAEWAMVIALSLVWGGSFFFVGVAVKEVPTFTIVVSRVAIAALALWIVVAVTGVKVPGDRRVWAAFFGMGLLNNAIPFCLIVWGQVHIASRLASILNATTPLFTVLVAHCWTSDEKLTPGRIAGVLVGFAGVFGRRFKEMGVDPVMTATGQVTASSLILLPAMLLIDRPWELAMPSIATIACLLALAILSTALAYILYFRVLAAAGATNLLIVTFLVPVSAILLGVGFLNEVLETKHLVGMALIGLGLAFIDGRLFRNMVQRQPAQ